MLRRVLIVMSFLVIGVVVNYGVALGLVLAYPEFKQGRGDWQYELHGHIGWLANVAARPGSALVLSLRDSHANFSFRPDRPWVSPRQHTPNIGGIHQPRSDGEKRTVEARGWPRYAVRCEYQDNASGIESIPLTNDGGIHISTRTVSRWGGETPLVLPVRPIPLGFTINTLLYASIAASMWLVPRAAIRRWRSTRRCCLACGYPVGESERCSECGAEVA